MIANSQVRLASYFVNHRVCPDGNREFSMSVEQFEMMHQHFHFFIQLYDLFNEKFCSMV